MKALLNILLICILILALAASVLAFVPIKSNNINHLILSLLEKKAASKLEFKTSRIWLPGDISLGGISVAIKGGRIYTAETLEIKYSLVGILSGKKAFHFKAKAVMAHQDISLLDSVSNMLGVPKMLDVTFSEVEGNVDLEKDRAVLNNITVSADNMSVAGDGWVTRSGDLTCTLHFSFSGAVTDKIPEIVRTALLTKEDGGWMGLTLKTSGNYTKPSLRIDSDTFIMNIKEGSLKIR